MGQHSHPKRELLKVSSVGQQFIRERVEKEESPKLDNIFIDIGAKDKKEVEKMGVHVGCVITYPDRFQIVNKNKFVCRAIDNRAGGFMIAEVGSLL